MTPSQVIYVFTRLQDLRTLNRVLSEFVKNKFRDDLESEMFVIQSAKGFSNLILPNSLKEEVNIFVQKKKKELNEEFLDFLKEQSTAIEEELTDLGIDFTQEDDKKWLIADPKPIQMSKEASFSSLLMPAPQIAPIEDCPSGHIFGEDCDSYFECEDCKLWNGCHRNMITIARPATNDKPRKKRPPYT